MTTDQANLDPSITSKQRKHLRASSITRKAGRTT